MLRMSFATSIGMVAAAIGLAGCNQTTASQTSAPVASAAVAPANPGSPTEPAWPPLPEGAACTGELNRFQTILKSDAGTGNLNRSVYDKIQTELKPAAEACAAGKDAEAHKLVQASKARHGYRA
jgi:hypothetical protein